MAVLYPSYMGMYCEFKIVRLRSEEHENFWPAVRSNAVRSRVNPEEAKAT